MKDNLDLAIRRHELKKGTKLSYTKTIVCRDGPKWLMVYYKGGRLERSCCYRYHPERV